MFNFGIQYQGKNYMVLKEHKIILHMNSETACILA